MEDLRFPRNPNEGIIFGLTITAISCALIGGANMYWAVGPEKFPTAFVSSYLFVLLFAFLIASMFVEKVAGKVVSYFYHPGDSMNSRLCYNLIVFVLLMSAIMSLVGPFAGQLAQFIFDGEAFDIMHILENWPCIWPRNFCVAFWVELLIAQPAARRLMVHIHTEKQ